MQGGQNGRNRAQDVFLRVERQFCFDEMRSIDREIAEMENTLVGLKEKRKVIGDRYASIDEELKDLERFKPPRPPPTQASFLQDPNLPLSKRKKRLDTELEEGEISEDIVESTENIAESTEDIVVEPVSDIEIPTTTTTTGDDEQMKVTKEETPDEAVILLSSTEAKEVGEEENVGDEEEDDNDEEQGRGAYDNPLWKKKLISHKVARMLEQQAAKDNEKSVLKAKSSAVERGMQAQKVLHQHNMQVQQQLQQRLQQQQIALQQQQMQQQQEQQQQGLGMLDELNPPHYEFNPQATGPFPVEDRDPARIYCDQCPKSFGRRSHLNEHKDRCPFIVFKYMCKWPRCGKKLTTKRTAEEHVNSHTGGASRVCVCGKTFSNQPEYSRHRCPLKK